MIIPLHMLTFVVLIGSALVAGIFFAFSTFIMKALARRPSREGIAAMQAINVTVINPWFIAVFFGTAIACVLVVIFAIKNGPVEGAASLLSASALYLFGCILVTGACNVPLNNRLAAVEPGSAEAEALWKHYLSRWTFWNHVRTAASLAAAVLFALVLWA